MKKILLFCTVLVAGAVMFVFEGCQSSKSSTASKMLKFDLEKGKAYDYETIVNIDQDIMGQSMTMDFTTYYSMKVDDDENGTKNISGTVDRFKMKTAVAGFNIDVDTDKPVTVTDSTDMMGKPMAMLNKVFGAMKGQQFSMRVSPEGKLINVSGFTNLAQKIADSLGLDASERGELLKEFEGQFNEDEMRHSFERVWYIFPNKEVKVGDSWEKTTELKGKMPGRYKSTYKVTEIEGDMVTLEETTTIESMADEKVSITGDISGTLVIDSRSGLMVNADQELNLKASSKGISSDIKGKSKTKGVAR